MGSTAKSSHCTPWVGDSSRVSSKTAPYADVLPVVFCLGFFALVEWDRVTVGHPALFSHPPVVLRGVLPA